MLYDLIPTMPEGRLVPLMARFAESVAQCGSFSALFEVVRNEGMAEVFIDIFSNTATENTCIDV